MSTGDHVCPWWLAYTFDNWFRRLVHKPEKVLASYVKPGMTVLDVGCGMGHFSLGMARLVGPNGKVISVDLQEQMLQRVRKRAEKAGLSDRIITHVCHTDRIGVTEPIDFALAFWMVHEVPDMTVFFTEIRSILKPSGKLLIVEPAFHVKRQEFSQELDVIAETGLSLCGAPDVLFSLGALFSKEA